MEDNLVEAAVEKSNLQNKLNDVESQLLKAPRLEEEYHRAARQIVREKVNIIFSLLWFLNFFYSFQFKFLN